jgi:hypothetical protein
MRLITGEPEMSDSTQPLSIDAIMSAKPFKDNSPTYSELLVAVATLEPSDSQSDAITALEAVTVLWEMVFQHFGLYKMQEREELSMLMYGDDGATMLLLENACFLSESVNTGDLNRDEFRLASSLKRPRAMTTWASRGFDIDKRCHGAIEAHVELRPLLRVYYDAALSSN